MGRWSAARREAEDLRLLAEALESLERAGCVFQFCRGPGRVTACVTCHVCAAITHLRRRLGLPLRQGVEGAVPIQEARYAAYLRQATAGPSADGTATISTSFRDDRRWVG